MYPLLLSAPLTDYLWGGQRLKTEYGFDSEKEKVAEAWVLSNRQDGQSLVLNGELKGKTLGEAIEAFGDGCLGENAKKFKYFPLLIKFIDAKQKLSVQVHPDDDYALKNEGEFGKTEMWYILDCIPDAKLIYGLKREVSAEELKFYIEEDRITEICNFVPVHKGDAFFIPSGTIHAIGEGILIAEVQQNSNITYRVSDYGRLGADGKPRALHKQKAFEVISRKPTPVAEKINAVINSSGMKERQLASCKYFNVKSILLDGEYELFDDNSFVSVLVLEGECELKYNDNDLKLKKGSSVFVPAGIKVHISGKAELLISCV